MMGIAFDPVNKHILITSPTKELTALEIYSAAMDWVDDQANIGYDVPMQAVGKFDMGGGVYSDSIFMLVNGWKIKFWSGTYQAIITGTLLPEPGQPRTVPPDTGNVEVVFSVSSQATIIPDVAEWTQTEKNGIISDVDAIKPKTDVIPEDLPEVPTHPELIAQHGSGSWEGATPTQTWTHPTRTLTSRDIVEVPGEEIASEDTLTKEIAEIKELLGELEARAEVKPPESISEYLTQRMRKKL